MSNLYNTPRSQFPERLQAASAEEIASFLASPEVEGDWRTMAQAEADSR